MWTTSYKTGNWHTRLTGSSISMTNFSATVCCLVVLFSTCLAHLCLLTPKQRGSISGLDKPGSDDCSLTDAPCGKRSQEKPQTSWQANDNFTVIFQKNLDHYTSTSPGYFSVNLLVQDQEKELARVPDAGEPSLHLYTVSGPLPMGLLIEDYFMCSVVKRVKNTEYTIQVTYVTKNPSAPPAFYQCSDVMIR